jgi:translocator protein
MMRSSSSYYQKSLQSCVEIVALTATAAATGVAFFNVNKLAGLLFIPYIGWLSFATYLNYSIYRMNPAIEEGEKKDQKEN